MNVSNVNLYREPHFKRFTVLSITLALGEGTGKTMLGIKPGDKKKIIK